MFEMSETETRIVSRLFLLFGILDIAFFSLTSYIVVFHSPRSCRVYRWFLFNNLLLDLICDLTLSILSPVLITDALGCYWISVFTIPAFVANWIFSLTFACVDGIIISISVTCYYRMRLAVPPRREKLLMVSGLIVYGLNYTTVPVVWWAIANAYVGNREQQVEQLLLHDENLSTLASNPYPHLLYDTDQPYMALFAAYMIPQIVLQILVLLLVFSHNILHIFRNQNYNISMQTKVLQTQIYTVMLFQVCLLLVCGGGEAILFVIPTLIRFFVPGSAASFLDSPLPKMFFDVVEPVLALAPLIGCCHSTINCAFILAVTKNYRQVIRRWIHPNRTSSQIMDDEKRISVIADLRAHRRSTIREMTSRY